MPNAPDDYAVKAHELFLKEREGLIDAAREGARTFDKAVLTFGSAIFGASIAFLKDVAPKPGLYTLPWLFLSWGLFSIGLLIVMLSFLFSQKACMFEIKMGAEALENPNIKRSKNCWSSVNDWCNFLCVISLFLGLLSWCVFAYQNLASGENTMSKSVPPTQTDSLKKSFTPPRNPPPPPPRTPPPPPPPPQK